MKFRSGVTAALAVGALGTLGVAGVAQANHGSDHGSDLPLETLADYTPFARFSPLPTSASCVSGGNFAQPFVIPPGYRQDIVAQEPEGGTKDLWDMNTQNESGTDKGRFIFRTHEVGAALDTQTTEQQEQNGGQVSVTDLRTDQTRVLAERRDFERFDGIVWTPQETILAAEETTKSAAPDPQVPQAQGGLVYEFFVNRDDPSRLDPAREPIAADAGGDPSSGPLVDGTTDRTPDGIRARPAVGSKAHEGMRFDKNSGFLYGISEVNGGAVYRFVPDRKGDLSTGELQALKTPDGRNGEGVWLPLDRASVQVDADASARAAGANGYMRPEDLETSTSTGRDRNNGQQTVYFAETGAGFSPSTNGGDGTGNVIAIDTQDNTRPFVYPYAGPQAGNTPPGSGFQSPDNLALDHEGNLAIAEDPGGNFPAKNRGDDVFIAKPPKGGQHQPAETVQRFASLTDCDAEPTGIYFSGQENDIPRGGQTVRTTRETLFVDQQHAGSGRAPDKLIAITPVDQKRGSTNGR